MQCNKAGCRTQFHVTCAQSLGLLCEEAGNYLDNVKYCGYCQHHYSKLVREKPTPSLLATGSVGNETLSTNAGSAARRNHLHLLNEIDFRPVCTQIIFINADLD
jgi:hypothetical protein